MGVETEVVVLKKLAPANGVQIDVAIPVFSAAEVVVTYGRAAIEFVQVTDYLVTLLTPDDFDTFTITPTASMRTKIDALRAADATEEDAIWVRRKLDYLSDSSPAYSSYSQYVSLQHDRSVARDQQLQEQIDRTVKAPVGGSGAALPPRAPGLLLGWSLTGELENKANAVGAMTAVEIRDFTDTAPYVATRAALKALDTTKDKVAILTEQGREGIFMWRAGNFTAIIAADVAEGLYVKASAVAASAGAWVRRRDDLDAMIDWFGAQTGAAAGANAAANDAAFASARALANVFTIKYSGFIYEHATTLTLNRSGLSVKGYAGFPVFGNGGATTTIIKWTGADGGLILQIREANGNDCSNNTIEGIEFDGNFLAGLGVDVINTQFATVRKCSIHNMRSAGTPIGLRTGTTAVAGTGINCAYRGRFEDITIGVTNNGVGVYLGGTAGVGNTTFCVYENIHVVHKDNAGFYLSSCDDVTFINCATSRIAAGTGNAITFDGTGAQWVVGNQFYGFHAGVTDGVATIVATGAKARQNKIYGSSGVDNNPTITMIGGAHLQYDFLGTGYSSDLATEAAMHLMAAAHVTKLRLGYDYAVNYATWDRDATANGKAIRNNPGTGGHEWQIGGVPTVNFTLGNLTITSAAVGAGVGPLLELFRDRNSANADNLGYIYATGKSSTGVKRTFGDMFWTVVTATNGAEVAQVQRRIMVGGTNTNVVTETSTGVLYPTGYKLDFGAGNYTVTHSAGTLSFNGSIVAVGLIAAAGFVGSNGAASGVGYATGAGGTVAQATSKATAVALARMCGAITMNAASLAAGTIVSFDCTNAAIAATDLVLANHISAGTLGAYSINPRCSAGKITFDVRNNTAGALAEAIVIQFGVYKAVNA